MVGFTTKSCKDQLQSFLNRTVKFRYYKESDLTISEIADKTDYKLFNSIKDNSSHCLYKLLPPIKNLNYSLRSKGHNFILPQKDDRNFINRCF